MDVTLEAAGIAGKIIRDRFKTTKEITFKGRADLVTDSSMSDWTQRVDLEVFDTTNLTSPTADDPADGITPGTQKLYSLEVTIEHDDTVVDSFRWWITP